MKLSIVIPVMNQLPLFREMYLQLRKVTDTLEREVEFVVIDNGSSEPITVDDCPGAHIFRNGKSIGVYPTFKQGFEFATGDVVAFFHSDLIVWEDRWNIRLMDAFEADPTLGMIGFIGSNEIDSSGGRGLGTTSNFKGFTILGTYKNGVPVAWVGSAGHIHGKVSDGLSPAAVVDGCAMVIRRSAYDGMDRADFPPHHFYDRLISTQLLEKGFKIAVLGIACDHISGQTVNQEPAYQQMAWEWLTKHGMTDEPFDPARNYDQSIYLLAEALWQKEYRIKGLIPTRV